MAAQKGKPNPNAGRKPGIPNKATTQAREAIAMFVEGNVDRLNGWLDEICRENGPMAAFDRFMSVVEYHIPKLQRAELTGPGGGDVVIKIEKTVRHIDAKPEHLPVIEYDAEY